MNGVEARSAYLRVLLDRVRQDRYPSATHMAMIEEALPPELIPDYVEVLIEKVADEAHPSIAMLRRVARLVDAAG